MRLGGPAVGGGAGGASTADDRQAGPEGVIYRRRMRRGGGGQRKVEGAGDVEAGGKPKEEGKRWPDGGEELQKKDKEGVTGHAIE
jgi:hypothetical protein